MTITRREFFVRSGIYGGSIWLAAGVPFPLAARAAAESTKRESLSEKEWELVEAIVSRLIPSEDGPGAREAGCTNFIDKALAHEEKAARELYRGGLAGVAAAAEKRFGKAFVELSAAEQDEILVAMQKGALEGWPASGPPPGAFFEAIRVHTLFGFLADPKYGGNRDYVGWKHVGYPGPRHHQGGYTPEQMAGTAKIKTIWGEEI